MKQIQYILCLIFVFSLQSQAQNKLTLEDIWSTYKYYPMGIPSVQQTNSDTSVLTFFYPHILKIDYRNVHFDTLLDCSKFPELQINNFTSNGNETTFLLASKVQSVRRDSEKAIYYLYSAKSKTITPLIDSVSYIQNPTFSTNNESICYFKDNNLFVKQNNVIQQITSDGKSNEIINGMPDWVYEEEFNLKQAYAWSSDGKNIAYLKFNESQVPLYQIPEYDSTYPTYISYKYPKPGFPNSMVTAYVYNVASQKTIQLQIPISYEYIPEFKWIDTNRIALTLLNRHQNQLSIFLYDISKNTYTEIVKLPESSTYYDIPTYFTPIPNSDLFVIRIEDSKLHVYDYYKGFQYTIAENSSEITNVYGYFSIDSCIYFQSTKGIPYNRYVCKTPVFKQSKMQVTILDELPGTHDMKFSNTGTYRIHEYSNVSPHLSICFESNSIEHKPICNTNSWMSNLSKSMNFSQPTFFKIPTEKNEFLHAYYILPHNFKKNKKYPVIVNVYGGPGNQEVMDQWTYDYYWYQFLAQEGYVVIAVDGRGTDGRGFDFRKQTYLQLGNLETKDYAATADFLKGFSFVDSKNIAIQGWSYGGYISLLTAGKFPDAYKAVVSIAPVTDWRYYDNIYTERYMRTPEENPDGYTNASILTYTMNIKAKVLIAFGTADDNVHPQNSYTLIREFINNSIDFEQLSIPNDEHSLFENNSRFYLYSKIFEFYEKELKPNK